LGSANNNAHKPRNAPESLVMADIVAKVPAEPPGQGNSAIIESERPVL